MFNHSSNSQLTSLYPKKSFLKESQSNVDLRLDHNLEPYNTGSTLHQRRSKNELPRLKKTKSVEIISYNTGHIEGSMNTSGHDENEDTEDFLNKPKQQTDNRASRPGSPEKGFRNMFWSLFGKGRQPCKNDGIQIISEARKDPDEDEKEAEAPKSAESVHEEDAGNLCGTRTLQDIDNRLPYPVTRLMLEGRETKDLFTMQLNSIKLHRGNEMSLLFCWKLISYDKAKKKYKKIGLVTKRQEIEDLIGFFKAREETDSIIILLKDGYKIQSPGKGNIIALQVVNCIRYSAQKSITRLICEDDMNFDVKSIKEGIDVYSITFNQQQSYCLIKIYVKENKTKALLEMFKQRLPEDLRQLCDTAKFI